MICALSSVAEHLIDVERVGGATPSARTNIKLHTKNMPEDFSKNLVKTYEHWEIYVNQNQAHLGRCVVWCKRENATDLADATKEEQQELFLVLHNLREAIKKAFQADWFNYSFLGNVMPHLHCHFTPRYAKPKTFMGVEFTDTSYGGSYHETVKKTVPSEVLYAIRDKLAEALK